MSGIFEKLVRWWENIKYPEDKEKEQRINKIIDEMKEKNGQYNPKKPRLVKNKN